MGLRFSLMTWLLNDSPPTRIFTYGSLFPFTIPPIKLSLAMRLWASTRWIRRTPYIEHGTITKNDNFNLIDFFKDIKIYTYLEAHLRCKFAVWASVLGTFWSGSHFWYPWRHFWFNISISGQWSHRCGKDGFFIQPQHLKHTTPTLSVLEFFITKINRSYLTLSIAVM